MDGQPEAVVDLDAVQGNVAAICRHVGTAQVMAVVKSDGYGHGMLASARAALAGGATWLGVVHVSDAIALRAAGLTVPVLSLHGSPDSPHAEAIRRDIDLTAGSAALVDQIALAAEGAGQAGPAAPGSGHRDEQGRGDPGGLAGPGRRRPWPLRRRAWSR